MSKVSPASAAGAASGFFSGIVREPLAGVDCVCPVPLEGEHDQQGDEDDASADAEEAADERQHHAYDNCDLLQCEVSRWGHGLKNRKHRHNDDVLDYSHAEQKVRRLVSYHSQLLKDAHHDHRAGHRD